MTVEVRLATLADLDAVLRIGHETWRATYTPIAGAAYVERGLAGWWTRETNTSAIEEGRVLVAEHAGEVVGMAGIGTIAEHLWIYRLYVLPTAQGLGVGSRLLGAVEAGAADGVTALRLSYLDGNDRARAFYEHVGFVATGERMPSKIDGPDDIVMERPITSTT